MFEKERTEISKRYQAGEFAYWLAEAFNCHRSATKQLAERYHISDNAVSRRLKKVGVKMRARWDY